MHIPVLHGTSKRVFAALIDQMRPRNKELDLDNSTEILFGTEKMLREMSFLSRLGCTLALWFFNLAPLCTFFSLRTFLRLSPGKQREMVQDWSVSDFALCREFMRSMRGLIYVNFYSDPRVWKYLHYDPGSHAAEKVALRQQLLAEVKPEAHL